MIRIVIADDNDDIRDLLRMYIGLDPKIHVVGEAVNGQEAVELVRLYRPDVAILDLAMPIMDGMQAARIIAQELPEVKLVALSGFLEARMLSEAKQSGFSAYLEKGVSLDEITRVIYEQ